MKWIKICSNEGSGPFPRGDNEITEVCYRNLKNLLLKNQNDPISIKLGTRHILVKGIQLLTNMDHLILTKEIMFCFIGERCGTWDSCSQ